MLKKINNQPTFFIQHPSNFRQLNEISCKFGINFVYVW